VSNTAERLAGFILTKAVGLARRNADIDALVKLQRDGLAVPFKGLAGGIYAYQAMGPGRKLTLEGVEAELIPALLATAGRHDEVRQALADYISHGGEKIDTREYHRFARQLTRYLDGGGDLPLPSTPARWPARQATARARPNIGEAFREARRGVHAKKEAFDAVRAGLKGLKDVAVAGAEFTKIFREDWEPPTDPDWLKAPERAAYPVSGVTARWAAVELDPDATDQFLPVMEAAAERDEDPHTRGRLNEISDEMPYLLEVALPTPPPEGNT
jgi:hypothetical protein